MTWTVIYMSDDSRHLCCKIMLGPHGRAEAWDFISHELPNRIVAIFPGGHEAYFGENPLELNALN